MDNRQRAILALKIRERARAGKWVPRRHKIAMIVVVGGLFLSIWATCRQPEPVAIGISCFLSGVAFTLFFTVASALRRFRAAWPFTEMVTNWNEVRELAGEPVNPPGQTPDTPPESN